MLRPFGYVNAEYLRRAAKHMQHVKHASYMQMQLQRAARVLDAGCGPGIDTVAMAALLPVGGEVVGVDIDPEMIREADVLAKEQNVHEHVKHVLADVYDLPFEDASFDACRAERLFQNIPESHDSIAILGELLRVLKPGGRIVLVDTDYGSASLDLDNVELERKMMEYCATRLRPNGLIARRFYRMLQDANITDAEVKGHTLVFTTLEDSPFGSFLADAAVRDGVINSMEAGQWMNTLQAREREGTFFSCLNILVVSGTKE